MSLRNIEVQYIGDTLYLPPLEREVNHIIVRNEDVKDWEHFEPKRTCKDVSERPSRFKCSECGCVSLEIAAFFCPICGAKVVNE